MKTKADFFLKNIEEVTSYKEILICGQDEVLINYVRDCIIREFQKKNYFIDRSNNAGSILSDDLFSDKKSLCISNDFSFNINNHNEENASVLFYSINNKKINDLKKTIQNQKHGLVIECYTLSNSSKQAVIKDFIAKEGLDVASNVYWYLSENLENDYVFLLKQLESLSLLNKKIDNIRDVEMTLVISNKTEINKIFFQILKNNNLLTKTFYKNIYSLNDFNFFLNSLKIYLGIISTSSSKEIALSKFPKYMFNEKETFLKIYHLSNKEKLQKIYKGVFRVESLVRKNSEMFDKIGLRFLINIKKIITS